MTEELQRVAQATYSENFIPEVNDALPNRDKIFAEFIKLTNSCLTQSRVLGILNQQLTENDIIVAAAGSLPGDLQQYGNLKAKIPIILNMVILVWDMKLQHL